MKKNTTTTAPAANVAPVQNAAEPKRKSRKEIMAELAAVGSAMSPAEKFTLAADKRNATTAETVRAVMVSYMNGHQNAVKYKDFSGVSATTGNLSEYYPACLLNLYTAALKYADSTAAERESKWDSVLFTAWKEYTALFAESVPATDTTPAATVYVPVFREDTAALYAKVTAASKAVLKAEKYTTTTGKEVARNVQSVKEDTARTYSAFVKEVERMIAERIIGVSGIRSRTAAADIRKANKATRESVLAPMQIIGKAAPKKSTAKKAANVAPVAAPAV